MTTDTPPEDTQALLAQAVAKPNMLEVTVYDGKYTVIQDSVGRLFALRYGEPWRYLVGDGLVLALAYEVSELREKIRKIQP